MNGGRRAAGRRPAALYAVAKLAIEPRAAAALEATIAAVRPRYPKASSSPVYHVYQHGRAAIVEAHDLLDAARGERIRLEASRAPLFANIAGAAERALASLAAELRARGATLGDGPPQPGGALRPSVEITFKAGPCAGALAREVASSKRVEMAPGKRLRRPLLALARDVRSLALHLGADLSWCAERGVLSNLAELSASTEALARRIVEQVHAAGARSRRPSLQSMGGAGERRREPA